MSTELTLINQEELERFIAHTGAAAEQLSGGGDFLPKLLVNYHDEDADKRFITPGLFYVTDQSPAVYAKNVVIRPLLHGYQWTQYDDVEEKTVNRTIFVQNFNEEARDEKGTVRCGKPAGKVLRDNPELKTKYDDVTLYRTVHVLVSYVGVDADGNEHTIENLPAVMRLKGSNFMPFGEEYLDNLPKGSVIWDYEIKLGVKKEKQGTVSYWVIHFDADFAKKVPLTLEVFETMKVMQSRIDAINKDINTKYYTVLTNNKSSSVAIDALDITPRGLDDDFVNDDDIPF